MTRQISHLPPHPTLPQEAAASRGVCGLEEEWPDGASSFKAGLRKLGKVTPVHSSRALRSGQGKWPQSCTYSHPPQPLSPLVLFLLFFFFFVKFSLKSPVPSSPDRAVGN